MDLVAFPQKEKHLKVSLKEFKAYLIVSLVLAVGIYFLHHFLYERDFAEELFLFMGEKAGLAHHGASPDIDNWLFVTPLIPYTLTLYLKSPYIAQSLISGLMWALWLFAVWILYQRDQISRGLAILLGLFLLLTPSSVWFFIAMPQLAFVYTCFIISLYALRRYYYEGVSSEFLVFALASALVVQNNIPSLAVYLAYLPVTIMVLKVSNRPIVPLVLVILFPTLFFIVAPLVMNGLLHSDYSFSGLFHYFPSFNVPLYGYEWNLKETVKTYGFVLKTHFIFLLPYALFWLTIGKHGNKLVYISFLMAPLIYIGVKLYTGTYIHDNGTLMLFPLVAILLMSAPFGEKVAKDRVHSGMLMLAFGAAALFDVMTLSDEGHKHDFYKALTGAPFTHHNIAQEKALAKMMGDDEGLILTDDKGSFKVLYILNQPERVVVPYQYRFQTSLSKPDLFVQWVLISTDYLEDKVLFTYPEARFGILPGFELAHQLGPYILFKRLNIVSN